MEVTRWGQGDFVDNILSSQDAYFYLKKDEDGSVNFVVQAKLSTMFACAGKWSVGINFVTAWELGKKLYQTFGDIENKSLQDYLDDPELYNLLDIDSEAVLDYYETIMKNRGEYYLD